MSIGASGRTFGVDAALALAGAILPYVIFVPWLAEHGLDGRVFLSQLFATGPATIFAVDAGAGRRRTPHEVVDHDGGCSLRPAQAAARQSTA